MEDPQYKNTIGTFIRACTTGSADHGQIVVVGHTPEVLLTLPGFGISQLPLVIQGKIIDKVFFDHGITKVILERLYDAIAQPKAVFRSDTTAGGAVIVTFETRPVDLPVIVALHPGKVIGRRAFNVIASVYAKNNANIEQVWRQRGLLLWEKAEEEAEAEDK